jgi:alanine dehydrogenase
MRSYSAADVRKALPMPLAIEAMREAFGLLARGAVDLPVRTAVDLPDRQGVFLVMPCRAGSAFGAKLVSVIPGNRGIGLPAVRAVMLLFDPETGEPDALIDGDALTAIRTGAASGLATDLLAQPAARRVAILGAGVQARTQLEAVCCVRDIESAVVWSRTPRHAEQFAGEMAGREGIPAVHVAGSARAAVADADVVCTATAARDPILMADDVPAGTHVNAVGSFTPEMRELDSVLLGRARVIVDHRPAAMAEAGEVIAAVRDRVIGEADLIELGSLVDGAVGRRDAREITVFKSVGVAVQDVVAARWMMRGSHPATAPRRPTRP